MKKTRHRWRIAATVLLVVVTAFAVTIALLWGNRPDISNLGWPVAQPTESEAGAVKVTWLGITTLLFDDGETQILTDGTFTRVNPLDIVLQQRVSSDVAIVNYALAEFRLNRLAAIIPVHSHFDHAIDVGLVANRSSAVVLGSESTANIVRGANLPVDQYQILANGESRQFGDFTITVVHSRHAPVGFGDDPWFPGRIEEPLVQPARVRDWKDGVVYSIFISHPRGTTLVQASGGFIENNLDGRSADVVMIGIAGLAWLGRDYVDQYWAETVTPLGASRIFPIHHDDFTRPFGEIATFPTVFDNIVRTGTWISELAQQEEAPPSIELLPFGKPIVLY